MKQKHAFILALILTFLIASNVYLFANLDKKEASAIAHVERVIDGDTLVLNSGETIRLININAPEKSRYGFNEATLFLKQLENQTINIEPLGYDKYGRTLARVYSKNNYVNLEIVKQGFASKYLVRDRELKEYVKAEAQAINSEKGIWKKSANFNCLELNKNKHQIIEITNFCDTINLTRWILKDESRKEYNFPDTSINNYETLAIQPQIPSIWQEKRNSIYIFNTESELVHYETYGY